MPGYLDPRTGMTWGWDDGENNWGGPMNKSLQDIAYVGTHPLVQSLDQSQPPIAAAAPGDMYGIGSSPTGMWASFTANSLVVWGRDPTQSYRLFVWIALTPKEGWIVFNSADKKIWAYNGTAWILASAVSSVLTDGTTALGIGSPSDRIRVANPFTPAFQTKLAGIETGAQANVKPDWNALIGTPAEILNKPAIAGGNARPLPWFTRTSYTKSMGLVRNRLYETFPTTAGNIRDVQFIDNECFFWVRRGPYMVIIGDGVTAYTSTISSMPAATIAARRQLKGIAPTPRLSATADINFVISFNATSFYIALGLLSTATLDSLDGLQIFMGDYNVLTRNFNIDHTSITLGSVMTINGTNAFVGSATGLDLGGFIGRNANFYISVAANTALGIAARETSTAALSAVNASGNLVSIV